MRLFGVAAILTFSITIMRGTPVLAQDDGGGDAPTNLVASGVFTGLSVKSVNLRWQDNSDTDIGFVVEAKPSTINGQWTPVAYTPNDYITLYSKTGYSTLGYYPGLDTGTRATFSFRVRAKYSTDPAMPYYSNSVSVTMDPSPTCSTTKKVSPVADFMAHVGMPIDLSLTTNINGSCPGAPIDYSWCVLSGPPGLTIDFNAGALVWTPTSAVPAANPVTIGYIPVGTSCSSCTTACAAATTSFTITVDDNAMTIPLFRDYRSEQSSLDVMGRAYDNFASYSLESLPLCAAYDGVSCPLTQESAPNSTPVGPGTSTLASWNLTPYPDGSRRLLSLIVQSPTKANSASYNPVILDRTSYSPNWPKRLPLASVRGALAVDLDGDRLAEIIATSRDSYQGGPYVWNLNGDVLWQAPGAGQLTESEVAVGDIDGDGTNDVVTVSKSLLRVFRANGSLMAQAQVTSPTTFTDGGASLADINGDRALEILVNTTDGTNPARTHIFKYNGTATLVEYSTDWPKTMAFGSASSRPSTADLDGDGHLDVIVDNHQYVYAWSTDPTHPLPGWPNSRVAIPPALYPLAIAVNGGANPNGFAQPAIVDLDGNGTPDIIVVGQNLISPTGSYLGCLNGADVASCSNPATKIPTAVGMSAAIGEFVPEAPGPEILLGGYVFSSSAGYSVGPIRTLGGGTGMGLSTLFDDGTGSTYATMGSLNQSQFTANLSAFESDGSMEEEYPKSLYGNTNCGSAPQVGDFDGDGAPEALVEITDASYGAVVALYRVPGEWQNSANNSWPMAGHDPQRTGRSYCKQQYQACTTDTDCCNARCNAGTCNLVPDCPSVSPCPGLPGSDCSLRGKENSATSAGFSKCVQSDGTLLDCGSLTVNTVTTTCQRSACCQTDPPTCTCLNSCGGSYLECR